MEKHSTSFIYKALWFVLAQTDGEELKPLPIPDGNASRRLLISTSNGLRLILWTATFNILPRPATPAPSTARPGSKLQRPKTSGALVEGLV